MKFAVGYQLCEEEGEEPCTTWIREYRDHIAEVYFPWGDLPSGRSALSTRRGYTDWTAQARLEADLREFRSLGLRLDLLFNANCYGAQAMSRRLEAQVASVLDHLGRAVGGVDTVTTTSPAIARTVKTHYPDVEVRASVNLRIGTVQGMSHATGLFDGFYVQRDYNRDLDRIRALKAWADANGKRLYLLANSGCLAFCPAQTFHDNLVAHESEVAETANIEGWNPHLCWSLLKDRVHWPAVLQSTWIRPEDLHHYDELFPVVKLATRMHARPRLVMHAYARRRHPGNLLDLLEPGFSHAFAPWVVDNSRFPADWFERTTTCTRNCPACTYCRQVLDQILLQPDATH